MCGRARTSSTARSSSRRTRSGWRTGTSGSRPPDDQYALGLDLIRTGRYFEAHEELELVWRGAGPEERDFFQGLVHVAVAWYQAGRGRQVGCERQLEKAARRLAPFAPAHRGVDVAAVLEQVAAARALVAAGSLELTPVLI